MRSKAMKGRRAEDVAELFLRRLIDRGGGGRHGQVGRRVAVRARCARYGLGRARAPAPAVVTVDPPGPALVARTRPDPVSPRRRRQGVRRHRQRGAAHVAQAATRCPRNRRGARGRAPENSLAPPAARIPPGESRDAARRAAARPGAPPPPSSTACARTSLAAPSPARSRPILAPACERGTRKYTPDIPRSNTFKDLQTAAAKLGIIECGKGSTAGRDWLRLADPVRLQKFPAGGATSR